MSIASWRGSFGRVWGLSRFVYGKVFLVPTTSSVDNFCAMMAWNDGFSLLRSLLSGMLVVLNTCIFRSGVLMPELGSSTEYVVVIIWSQLRYWKSYATYTKGWKVSRNLCAHLMYSFKKIRLIITLSIRSVGADFDASAWTSATTQGALPCIASGISGFITELSWACVQLTVVSRGGSVRCGCKLVLV